MKKALQVAFQISTLRYHPKYATFPSISNLAKLFQVNPRTIRRAIEILVEQEVVRSPKGRRTHWLELDTDSLWGSQPNARDRVYAQLLQMIESGEFEYGLALPKIRSLAVSLKTSDTTVIEVCSRLASDNWLHRKGKSYIVGSLAEKPVARINHSIVWVVTGTSARMLYKLRDAWSGKFLETFLNKCGQMYVTVQQLEVSFRPWNRQETFEKIQARARRLGINLKGVLVLGQTQVNPHLPSLLEMFSYLKIPTVWFDYSKSNHSHMTSGSYLFQMQYREDQVVLEALRCMQQKGYRKGVFCITKDEAWMPERAKRIAHHGKRLRPPIHIETLYWTFSQLLTKRLSRYSENLEELARAGPIPIREQLQSHLEQEGLTNSKANWKKNILSTFSPSKESDDSAHAISTTRLLSSAIGLYPLTKDWGRTVLIGANDANTDWFLSVWAAQFGYQLGRDIPCLSFDNQYLRMKSPVTSVNMGFDVQGEKALLLLLDAVPKKSITEQFLSNRPRCVDWGTLPEISLADD